MGCDIHMVVEVKVHSQWIGLHAFPDLTGSVFLDQKIKIEGELKASTYLDKQGSLFHTARGRNYNLFAALAGVRGEGPKSKGLPKNASALAKMESDGWGVDGHSHSYCSGEHFIKLAAEHEQIPDLVRATIEEGHEVLPDAIRKYLGADPEQYSEIRVVFWFDN